MRKYRIVAEDHTARYVQFEGDSIVQIQDKEDPIHDIFEKKVPERPKVGRKTPPYRPFKGRTELLKQKPDPTLENLSFASPSGPIEYFMQVWSFDPAKWQR